MNFCLHLFFFQVWSKCKQSIVTEKIVTNSKSVYTLSAEGPMVALLQSHKLTQMAPTFASDWSGDLSVVSVLYSAELILTNISA